MVGTIILPKPLQNVLKDIFVNQLEDEVQSEVARASMDNTVTLLSNLLLNNQ